MSDQIILTGMKFFGHHGCSAEERALGQTVVVDVELNLDLSKAGKSDDLNDTVDYVAVFDEIKIIAEGSYALIETIAENIADKIFSRFTPVETVKITVRKAAPVEIGGFDAAVSITRHAQA